MRIDGFLALRFLREGRAQTLLIMSGAAVGVAVIVFLSALIEGLQKNLIAQTLSTQPHIVVKIGDEYARPQRKDTSRLEIFARIRKPAQRLRTIGNWHQRIREISLDPRVTAVTPLASGPGFASRGGVDKAITLMGIEPGSYQQIYPVQKRMIAGRFQVSAGFCVIGKELSNDLGVGVGEKIRLSTSDGRNEVFRIAGLFDFGNREVNRRWTIISMRSAQSMLDMALGATSLEVRVSEIFDSQRVAEAITQRTGLTAESWTQTNTQLLVALRSQSNSSSLIQFFVILGVAIGIASVLVVSVVQKSRQIGILRAIGTPRGVVLRIFLIQGALVGVVGALVGSAAGSWLAIFFRGLSQTADGSPLFPIALTPSLFGRAAFVAIGTGLLAAWLPARRASRTDPAVAIRYE